MEWEWNGMGSHRPAAAVCQNWNEESPLYTPALPNISTASSNLTACSSSSKRAAENRHPPMSRKPLQYTVKKSLYLSACLIAPCLFSPRVPTLYSLSVSCTRFTSCRRIPESERQNTAVCRNKLLEIRGKKKNEIFRFPAPPVAPTEL